MTMRRPLWLATAMLCLLTGTAGHAQESELAPVNLPLPNPSPLSSTDADDPILAVANTKSDPEAFREVIANAVKASPSLEEARADGAAALAGKANAEAQLFPRIDLALSGNRAIAREFSNDPDNVIERARGNGRIDATMSAEQVLIDFGATLHRIDAAIARVEGSEAEMDRKTEAAALRAIGIWYDLFAYGHLVELAENYLERESYLRSAVEQRIAQGASAPVERARLDSAIASARLRLAQYQRELSGARARFTEIFGLTAPQRLARAPAPVLSDLSPEELTERANNAPTVRAADASARAAKKDARAAKADTLPSVSAGIDAGRFGLFEPGRRDYDVRGRLTLRYRLLGPGFARDREAKAIANAAEARAAAVRLETERETRIAWSDVKSLEGALSAYEADYRASRISRDAVFERFRVARGSLFDVLDTEDRLFMAAAGYIRAMAELDASTYVALARSGDLLPTLNLPAADQGMFK